MPDQSRPSLKAHDYIKSRTPEQRRVERDLRDTQRRQANRRGVNGIEVDGDVIRAGPELTDPAPFGINNGSVANGNTARLEVIENAAIVFYVFSATFDGYG